MADINNSDIKVIGNKIDNLVIQVSKLEIKQDTYHADSQQSIVLAEKQLALIEQSHKTNCKETQDNKEDIKTLSDRQDKNDTWTKIVGGIQGLFTIALTYFGINK